MRDLAQYGYRQLLVFFFQIHDPTTRNRQGNDVGTSYRSPDAVIPVLKECASQSR
jgi:peptide-methionine (S)-S-oxide reductase